MKQLLLINLSRFTILRQTEPWEPEPGTRHTLIAMNICHKAVWAKSILCNTWQFPQQEFEAGGWFLVICLVGYFGYCLFYFYFWLSLVGRLQGRKVNMKGLASTPSIIRFSHQTQKQPSNATSCHLLWSYMNPIKHMPCSAILPSFQTPCLTSVFAVHALLSVYPVALPTLFFAHSVYDRVLS